MLKFFFHRDSRFVRMVEAFGAVLFIPLIIKEHDSLVLWLYLFEYLFIRFSYNFNWYYACERRATSDERRELGIRLHFKKALVATSYIIFIMNLAFLLTDKMIFIYVGVGLLALVLYLHVILLYLHFRDKDERPPNFFSR